MTGKSKRGSFWIVSLSLLGLCLCCLAALGAAYAASPMMPEARNGQLFNGVTYERVMRWLPRPMVAHVVIVDLLDPGIQFLVTPPDDFENELPLHARTTSQFLSEYGLQVAVNGSFFTPWHSNSVDDYYPRPGDPVRPGGFNASRGMAYAYGSGVTLYIGEDNRASFYEPIGGVYNAITGDPLLVSGGRAVAGLDRLSFDPRTAIGISADGTKLIIIVVDGRQLLYSQGATFGELADLMVAHGAETAVNFDGGGSSTLVIAEPGGPHVLNSPIDNNIAGRERPVANHLGIYATRP